MAPLTAPAGTVTVSDVRVAAVGVTRVAPVDVVNRTWLLLGTGMKPVPVIVNGSPTAGVVGEIEVITGVGKFAFTRPVYKAMSRQSPIFVTPPRLISPTAFAKGGLLTPPTVRAQTSASAMLTERFPFRSPCSITFMVTGLEATPFEFTTVMDVVPTEDNREVGT